jgi:tRNA-dihydrouridine synthase B
MDMPLLRPVRIGSLITPNNIFLAPLAGIGDPTYRRIGRAFGAGLTFTEMVSANGLVRRNRKTGELVRISDGERPAGIQLFGSDPAVMGEAAGMCADERADLIDINAGCPVRKVLKTGAGAALLGDPARLFDIVRSCVAGSPLPISVKMRLGLREDRINLVENAIAAEEAGAHLLILHARTASAGYGGAARWEYIGRLKEAVSVPVCGNGDIRSPDDAVRMIVETGCDAVMVGRGAVGNPWLLRGIEDALSRPGSQGYRPPSVKDRLAQAALHLDGVIAHKGEERAVREMKRHLHRYVRGLPGAAAIRESLFRARTQADMREILNRLHADHDAGGDSIVRPGN